MPLYSFSNPNDPSEIIDLVMGMNDLHEYEKDGVKWDRVWYSPMASIDTKLDPFSSRDFLNKTGKKSDTLGSLLDRSKEMSMERERIVGKDLVKEKYAEDYKKRVGKEMFVKKEGFSDSNVTVEY